MNVGVALPDVDERDVQAPSPRAANSAAGLTRIHIAAATAIDCRDSPDARAARLRDWQRPRGAAATGPADDRGSQYTPIGSHEGGATRQVSIGANSDEIGRLDEAFGAEVRDHPTIAASRPDTTAAATTAIPAICRRPSTGSPASSAPAGERHAREHERADRQQHRLGGRRCREHRASGRCATGRAGFECSA